MRQLDSFIDDLAAVFRAYGATPEHDICEDDGFCDLKVWFEDGSSIDVDYLLDEIEVVNDELDDDISMGDIEGAINALPVVSQKELFARWVRRFDWTL